MEHIRKFLIYAEIALFVILSAVLLLVTLNLIPEISGHTGFILFFEKLSFALPGLLILSVLFELIFVRHPFPEFWLFIAFMAIISAVLIPNLGSLAVEAAEKYFTQGNALQQNGRNREAISFYNSTLKLKPGFADAYLKRGHAYRMEANLDRAISDYTKAIANDPSATAYYWRGSAYAETGRHNQAIEDYTRALRLNPKYIAAYNDRGLVYLRTEKYEHAIGNFNRAIRLDPSIALSYVNRGMAFVRTGKYEKALSDFDSAIQLDPDYILAYLPRGMTKQKLGLQQEACSDWEKACELGVCEKIDMARKKGLCP